MKRLPPTLERLAAGICLCVAFILMASVIAPDASRAQDQQPRQLQTAGRDSTPVHDGLIPLGMIEDNTFLIHVFADDQGPLYSIYSASDGRELAVLLRDHEVAERFPELPIPDMEFTTETPVLLVDPARAGFPDRP